MSTNHVGSLGQRIKEMNLHKGASKDLYTDQQSSPPETPIKISVMAGSFAKANRQTRTFVIKNHDDDKISPPASTHSDKDVAIVHSRSAEAAAVLKRSLTVSGAVNRHHAPSTPGLKKIDMSRGSPKYSPDAKISSESTLVSRNSGDQDQDTQSDHGDGDYNDENFCCTKVDPSTTRWFYCSSCKFNFCSRHWDYDRAHKTNEFGPKRIIGAVTKIFNDPTNEMADGRTQAPVFRNDQNPHDCDLVRMSEHLLLYMESRLQEVREIWLKAKNAPPYPPLHSLKNKQHHRFVINKQKEESTKRDMSRNSLLLQEQLVKVKQNVKSYQRNYALTQSVARQLEDATKRAIVSVSQSAARVSESESFLETCQARALDTRTVLEIELRRVWRLSTTRQTEIARVLAQRNAETKAAKSGLEECKRVLWEDNKRSQELQKNSEQATQSVQDLERNHLCFIRNADIEADRLVTEFQKLHRELNQLRFERQSLKLQNSSDSKTEERPAVISHGRSKSMGATTPIGVAI